MTDERITDFTELYCNGVALGQLLDLRPESIARLSKVEGMPKHKAGYYNVLVCVQWIIERERNKGAGDTPEDKKARMLVAEQQKIKLQIENATSFGELAQVALVQTAYNAMSSAIAGGLEGAAQRLAPILADITDPVQTAETLTNEFRRIRDNAADAVTSVAGVINSGADTEATTKPQRGSMG